MATENSKPTVLCVDDEISILKALARVFAGRDYLIVQASSAAEGLHILQQQPVHLIISDMRMPEMTGAEFLSQAAQLQPDAYRVLLTGYSDLSSTIAAINIGKIHRYLQKPWDNNELLSIVDEGLKVFMLSRNNKLLTNKIARQNKALKEMNAALEEMVQQRTQQLKKLLTQLKDNIKQLDHDHKALLEVLYNIISVHPQLSGEFALNVAKTTAALANIVNLPKVQQRHCYLAGLFSELGKIALPVSILNLPQHKLDNNERNLYFGHPQHAEDILLPAGHMLPVADIIAQQYERFNGTGVPHQLVGTAILPGARILAVARDYWGYVFQRLHPKSHSQQEALEAIKRLKGSHYDPEIVQALSKLMHIKPLAFAAKGGGIDVTQLRPGMVLQQHLFNHRQMLLLPKGHELTAHSIQKLVQYQRKHNEKLPIIIKGMSAIDLDGEE